jgi:hypothetical protein
VLLHLSGFESSHISEVKKLEILRRSGQHVLACKNNEYTNNLDKNEPEEGRKVCLMK